MSHFRQNERGEFLPPLESGQDWDGEPIAPLSGADLRAACETYLRENGWTEKASASSQFDSGPWQDPKYPYLHSMTTGMALGTQWTRDGIGGAT